MVLTGASAGALGALIWGNYVQSILQKPTALSVIADSGSFLFYPAYQIGIGVGELLIKNLFSVANIDEKTPNSLCNKRFVGEEWKCFSIE